MISKIKEVQIFICPECGRESEIPGKIERCMKKNQWRCQHENLVYEIHNYGCIGITVECSDCGWIDKKDLYIEDFNFSQEQLKELFNKMDKRCL